MGFGLQDDMEETWLCFVKKLIWDLAAQMQEKQPENKNYEARSDQSWRVSYSVASAILQKA